MMRATSPADLSASYPGIAQDLRRMPADSLMNLLLNGGELTRDLVHAEFARRQAPDERLLDDVFMVCLHCACAFEDHDEFGKCPDDERFGGQA